MFENEEDLNEDKFDYREKYYIKYNDNRKF